MKNLIICGVLSFLCLAAFAAVEPLDNCRLVFEREKKGTVAFLGGSITENTGGHVNRLMGRLRKRFPECQFTCVAAGVASTCSDTGAFRFGRDVLSKGRVDLLFVEFAVNDDQDGHFTREHALRGMEGIVRQARAANPLMDIVMIHFVNGNEIAQLLKGETPIPYDAHSAVAAHYGIPVANVGAELAQRTKAGTWKFGGGTEAGITYYGGEHPNPPGYDLAAELAWKALEGGWNASVTTSAPHKLPAKLDPASYDAGHFIPLESAKLGAGWQISLPDWTAIAGSKRGQYCKDPILWSDVSGSEFKLSFTGTAVGAFVTSFMSDAGALEVSVDGGPFAVRRLLSQWSYCLHYPRTVVLAEGLKDGPHEVVVRLVEDHKDAFEREQPNRAGGKVARIHALCVNGR